VGARGREQGGDTDQSLFFWKVGLGIDIRLLTESRGEGQWRVGTKKRTVGCGKTVRGWAGRVDLISCLGRGTERKDSEGVRGPGRVNEKDKQDKQAVSQNKVGHGKWLREGCQ